MPVTNDVYDQLKIDKLKHFLEAQAEKGQARPFEIFVDNLKVVSKTDDPKEFDSYEFYMNEDTEKVRILIYNSHLSPRNDQYCYMVQRNKTEKSLNGLGEIEDMIQQRLEARDREYELNRLKEELEDAREETAELEKYSKELEEEIRHLKDNKFKLGNINLGELASVALEGFVRRNPQMLSKIPGGEALTGIIEQDNQEKERLQASAPASDSQITIEKNSTADITEEEKRQLAYLRKFEQCLNREQAAQFNIIINAIVDDPSLLQEILTLIEQKKN